MEEESEHSFKAISAQKSSSLTAHDFQVVNMAGPGVVRPSIVDVCLDVIDDAAKDQVKALKTLRVEYIKSACAKGAHSHALVTVDESLRRQQDTFGRTCTLNQADLRKEYAHRMACPLDYDSDSSMSENEEYEIDSKSAPSLALSRQACGYYRRYDVSFTEL
jgi:hypothetical protein